MSESRHIRLVRLIGCLVVLVAFSTGPLAVRADEPKEEFYFHAPVPLGVEAVRIAETKKTVYLLASVENQSFDGLHVMRDPHEGRVQRVDGSVVQNYPAALDFRVTATAMVSDFEGIEPDTIHSKQPLNDFLLGMQFRLKVFRGLHMTVLKPLNVKIIGVPAYQPYDERIYRVSFDTPKIPVDARLVLEVLDSDGQRLSRFHLEML